MCVLLQPIMMSVGEVEFLSKKNIDVLKTQLSFAHKPYYNKLGKTCHKPQYGVQL